jgi:hypothetical protein
MLRAVYLLPLLVFAQERVPRFEDFPAQADWYGPNAVLKLTTPSERMFRTRLSAAAKESPDFAGHYRFAGWGCGSACAAGAIIDLQTGTVYPPPMGGKQPGWDRWIFSGGVLEDSFVEYRRDSRLMLVRRQAFDPAMQELHYFEWDGARFVKLLDVLEKRRLN